MPPPDGPSAVNSSEVFPAWLTSGRVIGYSRLIAAGYLVLLVVFHLMAARQAADGLPPMVTDFNTFYAVASLLEVNRPEAAYEPAPMLDAERSALAHAYPHLSAGQLTSAPLFTWLYPPATLMLLAPLGRLPYWLAYGLWNSATLLLWLTSVRRILPGAASWSVALALPGTFLNAMFGQMGFLTAGLLGWGLALLGERPALAGIAFGLLTIKPHFGLLLPLALLCGGHWRAIAAAAVTALALSGASLLIFGPAPWAAFLTHAGQGGALMEAGGVPWSLMPTLFPALRLLGVPSGAAYAAQAAAGMAAAAAVAWSWRRRTPIGLKASVLCLATLLALPFAHAYDLVVAMLPLFWLAAKGIRTRMEAVFVVLTALLPFLGPGLGKLGLPVSPLVIGGLLAVVLARVHRSPSFEMSSGSPL